MKKGRELLNLKAVLSLQRRFILIPAGFKSFEHPNSQTEQYSTFTQGSERSGIFPHAMIPFVHTCSCRHYRDTGTYTHIRHIDCRGNPPLQAHFYPNEWSRSRSKLINVPTAPERVLVRWQQRLLTAEEY